MPTKRMIELKKSLARTKIKREKSSPSPGLAREMKLTKKKDTTTRPCKRNEAHETNDDIEVLSRNVISIIFSIEDPRSPNWDPENPLLVIG